MKTRCLLPYVLLALTLAATVPPAALAYNENETTGFATNHIFDGSLAGETVDLLNGGLSFSVPIGPSYAVNRNLSYQLQLTYGSKIWDTNAGDYAPHQEAGLHRRSPMGLGFSMHFGRIYHDVETRQGGSGAEHFCDWYFVSQDGVEHLLEAIEPNPAKPRDCFNYPEGPTLDNSWYVVGGVYEIRDWTGPPSPAPILTVTTAEGFKLTFAHYVSVKADNGAEYNRPGGAYGESDINREYNRDFGGWYVTKIEDMRSSYDVGPGGSTIYSVWIAITYDTRPGFEHVMDTITDSLNRKVKFNNTCVPPLSGSTICDEIPISSEPVKNRYAVRTEAILLPQFRGQLAVDAAADPDSVKAVYTFTYLYDRAIRNLTYFLTNERANTLMSIQYPEFRTHDASNPANGSPPTRYTMTFSYANGELASRRLPTGAETGYVYGNYLYLGGGLFSYDTTGSSRHVVQRELKRDENDVHPAKWRYTRQVEDVELQGNWVSNPRYVIVSDPFGNDTVHYFRASRGKPGGGPNNWNYDDGYTPEWNDATNYLTEYYKGTTVGGVLMLSAERLFDADRNNSGTRKNKNVRMTYHSTTYHDDDGRQSQTAFRGWDGRGHFTVVAETGDEIDGTRITRTEWFDTDPSRFILREVSDGKRMLSRTDNAYGGNGGFGGRLEDVILSVSYALPLQLGAPVSHPIMPGEINIVTTYEYDASGNLTETVVGDKSVSYEPNVYTALSPKSKMRYTWQSGLIARKEVGDGSAYYSWKAIDRERDGNTGLVFRSRDTAGVATVYDYDSLGRLKTITASSTEYPVQIEYASVRRTVLRQGPSGVASWGCSPVSGDFVMTCYDYDTLGRVSQVQKRPYDGTLAYPFQTTRYDIAGRMTFQSEWLWPTDTACTAEPTPAACGTTYDLCESTSICSDTSPVNVDPFGRVRKVTTADGQITTMEYFGLNSRVSVKGIRGGDGSQFDASTTYYRDGWNRLIYVQTPKLPSGSQDASLKGGSDAQYYYDLRDNLVRAETIDSVTGQRQARTWEYDTLSRLRSSWSPEGGASAITSYDALGNIVERRDASGTRFFMEYDGAGRITARSRQAYQPPGSGTAPPVTLLETLVYDGTGSSTCTGGVPSGGDGCSNGKLIRTEEYDDAQVWLFRTSLAYSGLNGRLSRETPNIGNELANSIITSYNNFGLTSRTDYPEGPAGKGGAFAVLYTSSNGFPTQVQDALNPSVTQARVTYNAAGGFKEVFTNGSMRSLISTDVRNRPREIDIGKWSGSVFSRYDYRSGVYQYDGAGNIYRIGQSAYGYDSANRLISATQYVYGDATGTDTRSQTYKYDDYGNITRIQTLNGSNQPVWDDTFGFDDQSLETSLPLVESNSNRLRSVQRDLGALRVQRYDSRGNLIVSDTPASFQTYDYDSRGRLTTLKGTVGVESRYQYDGSDYRITADDGARGLKTYFVRTLSGQLLSEFRRASVNGPAPPEWSKHYVYLGGRLVALRENNVPQPPGGLTATTQNNGRVNLSWLANPSGTGITVTGYKVYRSPQEQNAWTLLTTTTGTSYTDTSSSSGLWYRYAVSATTATVESFASNHVLVQAGDSTAPTAPSNVIATGGDAVITLSWNPNPAAEQVVRYHVKRKVPPPPTGPAPGFVTIATIPATRTIYFDRDVALGAGLYTYTVTAEDARPLSAMSAEVTATPADFTPPSAPRNVRVIKQCATAAATSSGPLKLKVKWDPNPSTDNVSRYFVHRDPFFDTGLNPTPTPQLSTEFIDTDAALGTLYRYTVTAEDASHNVSVSSGMATARTPFPAGAIEAPPRPYAESSDSRVTVRVPISNWANTPTLRLYRKLNVEPSCEDYELVETITSNANIPGNNVYRDVLDAVPTNLAYDYAVTGVVNGVESIFSIPALATPVGLPHGLTQCIEEVGMSPPLPQSAYADAVSCGNSWEICSISQTRCQFDSDCPTGELCQLVCAVGHNTCTTSAQCTLPGDVCRYAVYLRRVVIRWSPPAARPYQPYAATFASGAFGYYAGVRPYYFTHDPSATDLKDNSSLVPVQTGNSYGHCSGHPDTLCGCISCPSCPAGESCIHPQLSGQCGGGSCYQDSECGSGSCIFASSMVDPYIVNFSDGRWHSNITSGSEDCLAVKAVYKILVNGQWTTVESKPTSNVDITRLEDSANRCLNPLGEICQPTAMNNFNLSRDACRLPWQSTPRPEAPTATPSSSDPGTISVSWPAVPAGFCALTMNRVCIVSSDCLPGEICQYWDDQLNLCAVANPETCTNPGQACQTSGQPQTCVATDVLGYNIYTVEVDGSGYHFKTPAPVAEVNNNPQSYDFKGLSSGSTFYFRVASVDSSGKVSPLSNPSGAVSAVSRTGSGLTAPMSLKVSLLDRAWRLNWDGPSGASYRVYRSRLPNGPFCAMLKRGTGNPAGITVCSDEAAASDGSVVGIEGAATQTATTLGFMYFEDEYIPVNVTYYYKVSVVSGASESPFSDVVAAYSLPELPSEGSTLRPPAQLRAWASEWGTTPLFGKGVMLQWCGETATSNPAYQGITGYKVYRSNVAKGPYSLLLPGSLPLSCLDGKTRCEIQCPSGTTPPCQGSTPVLTITASPDCTSGVDGTCKVVDMTVRQPLETTPKDDQVQNYIYYYVVTAVKPVTGQPDQESPYSEENSAWPHYCSGATCTSRRYDPDNSPISPCTNDLVENIDHSDQLLQLAAYHVGAILDERLTLTDVDASSHLLLFQANDDSALTDSDSLATPPEDPDILLAQGQPQPTPETDPGGLPSAAIRWTYFHLDHLGSPRVLTNAAGDVVSVHHYLPYGEELPSSLMNSSNTRQFTGHDKDSSSGLDYMMARYYSSSLGRLMAVDPSRRSVHLGLPQSWNRYSYAYNNPLSYTDPTGREPIIGQVPFTWWNRYGPIIFLPFHLARALGPKLLSPSSAVEASLMALDSPVGADDQYFYDIAGTQVKLLDSGYSINQDTGLLFDPTGYQNLPFGAGKNGFGDPSNGFAYQDMDGDGIQNKDDDDIDGDGTKNNRDPDPMDPNFGGTPGEEPQEPSDPMNPEDDRDKGGHEEETRRGGGFARSSWSSWP